MEEQKYGRSFPGCVKGLVHFLDLHRHLHLHIRKMKMLTYWKHGEGKRAARNKEPKTDSDAPSTSQQYNFTEDNCFEVEDKVISRKHPVKSSMRISIPKWGLREHNRKRKASLLPSRLLRTNSMHHWSEDHMNKASSSSERVYILSGSSDEYNIDKQCDDNMVYIKSGSYNPGQPDDIENILQIKQPQLSNTLNEMEVDSFVQKETNGKELQKDVILHPSKEFLAMMKLFDGNMELIQNILDDPSFIFAHYLHDKHGSNAELSRANSFPAPWQLERINSGQFRIKHRRFESEYLIKKSDNSYSKNLPTYTDRIEEDTPKEEMIDGDEERTSKLLEANTHSDVVARSTILQNARNNPPNSNRFMIRKLNKKDHHHIFMDEILHKIPFERKVMISMKKSKSGCWDGSVMEKLEGEGLIHANWDKINKHTKRNILRSQSLNESLYKYSHLYESISKEEVKGIPERMKVKSLERIFSLPDIKYCSSKNAQSEEPFTSPKNLTISHKEKILKKEESNEFATKMRTVIDSGEIPLQNNGKEHCRSCQISNFLSMNNLIREENLPITPQEKKLVDEARTYELTKPTQVSATGSLARGDAYLGFVDYVVSEGLEHRYPSEHCNPSDINVINALETKDIDLAKAKPFLEIDWVDSLDSQINQKDEAKLNFVREILKRYGFSDNEFLEALHSPYQPMDPLLFNEAEDLSYDFDFKEIEDDVSQLLFDLINEALVETYENFLGYFLPWLSNFNTNTRTTPMGNHHILEEIWANICWHLKNQPHLGTTLEDIVSRNFIRNDGWMNIQYDIEDVVLELECQIMNGLLDDLYFNFLP